MLQRRRNRFFKIYSFRIKFPEFYYENFEVGNKNIFKSIFLLLNIFDWIQSISNDTSVLCIIFTIWDRIFNFYEIILIHPQYFNVIFHIMCIYKGQSSWLFALGTWANSSNALFWEPSVVSWQGHAVCCFWCWILLKPIWLISPKLTSW